MKKFIFKILTKILIKFHKNNLWKEIREFYFTDKKYKQEITDRIKELYAKDKQFRDSLNEQVEKLYLDEQLPTYNISVKDTKVLEKLSDLWKAPEFKIWLGMQANRKNYLGKASLIIKYQNESDGIIKNSNLQGQAFNISLERNFLKRIHNKFQEEKSKKRSSKKTKKGK